MIRCITTVGVVLIFLVACGRELSPTTNLELVQPTITASPRVTPPSTRTLPKPDEVVTVVTATEQLATPERPAFPTMIGSVSLGMSAKDLLHVLGEPQKRTTGQGVGLPEWHFANGLIIDLSGPEDIGVVRGISASAPFDGKTPEGFGLGDTKARFEEIYKQFSISSFQPDQRQITDGQGLYLSVKFDSNDKAEIINILREG